MLGFLSAGNIGIRLGNTCQMESSDFDCVLQVRYRAVCVLYSGESTFLVATGLYRPKDV